MRFVLLAVAALGLTACEETELDRYYAEWDRDARVVRICRDGTYIREFRGELHAKWGKLKGTDPAKICD